MDRLAFEMQQLQRDVLAAFALAVHLKPDLPIAEPLRIQPQDFGDLAHG
jgi:hypothetical protein